MESSHLSKAATEHTARIDRTLRILQDRVKQQEALLAELRASNTTTPLSPTPSPDLPTQLHQLQALKGAYTTLTTTEPWLPPRDSSLPALLALRLTARTIDESRIAIAHTTNKLTSTTASLTRERAALAEAEVIQQAIEARTRSLQHTIQTRSQKTPEAMAHDMILALEARKTHYDTATTQLVSAFNAFIDTHLAPQLALEELGGPVVGTLPSVPATLLSSAFNTQGRPRRGTLNADERQRRIDHIWGAAAAEDDEEEWNEQRAAGAGMRELTEELLNRLVEAGGNGPGAYVELARESAAARFLVRAKVAQFHPRDARRLRLVDFGSEVEE